MAIKKFQEYLDSQGKTVEKPVDIMKDDGADKPPEKPEAIASKGKNWKGPSLAGKPNPYVAQGAKGNKGSDKGLGDMGTPTVDFEKTDSKSTVAAQIKESIKLKIAEAKEKLMKKLKKNKDSVGDELYGDGIASFEDDSK